MAKKRKTRQQKLIADHRHQDFSHKASPTISLTNPAEVSIENPSPSRPAVLRSQHPLEDFSSVRHDLIKTSSITGAIVLVELVLFFLLRP